MVLNTLLVLAVLAFVAYLVAPRIIPSIIRWRRYNQLCRIRHARAAASQAERRYADQAQQTFHPDQTFHPGVPYPVPNIDGIVHVQGQVNGTYIAYTSPLFALDREAQIAWAQELQSQKEEKEENG